MLTAAAAICAMHNLHPALSDEEGRKIASAERTVCHRGHCGFGELETARYVLMRCCVVDTISDKIISITSMYS